MIEIPAGIKNIVLYSDMPFESIAYDICNPKDLRFNGMSFEGKLFLTSKLLNATILYWDDYVFDKVAGVIDEKEFNNIVDKFNGMHFNYDGSNEDIGAVREVIDTILDFIHSTCDGIKDNDMAKKTLNIWFLSSIFHSYSPQTVFMINGKLKSNCMSFIGAYDTALKDGNVVPDEFKTQLKSLYEQNMKCFFKDKFLAYRCNGGNVIRYIDYVLLSYTLCQCIKSSGLTTELPYPVMINNIYNAVADEQEINDDGSIGEGAFIKKLTLDDVIAIFKNFNRYYNIEYGSTKEEPTMKAVIVYKQSNFTKPYALKERSYCIKSDSGKAFFDAVRGSSIYGNSLDGSDLNVRLDYYNWDVDYCYLIS